MTSGLYAAGDILGDRYVLKKSDWVTPLGPVWLARDRVLDRAVFVQLLAPKIAGDRGTRRAFQKAAARVAQVTHPGLLQVYDIGDDPAFAVFEHAAGGRLAERLQAGPMRPTDAARAVLGLARGLEALHDRGVWHGSLSPSCVLFDEEGRAKILAMGAAETASATRAASGIQPAADQPSGYAPLEADPIPADADRFALAALLYQMVTGKPPERGVSARAQRRGVPLEIDRLLLRALGDDPRARPSMDEFDSALAPFARVELQEARGPRFAASEFRWLVPVVLILILAGAALTVGVQIARDLANRKPATPKASATAGAAGKGLTIQGVTDFDPHGNGEEHRARAALTIDGKQLTEWTTVAYTTAKFGGDKDGVGLLFDLGSPVRLARAVVQTTLPGWQADLRISDTEGSEPGDYRVAASFTADTSSKDVTLPAATQGRYVLLWITRLAPNGSSSNLPFSASVNEVAFFGS